jgi:OTU domain-containing protein 6
MAAHEDDYSPFCELTDDAPDFRAYVDRVRSSADWGGHLELRALSVALNRPVVVYSAQSPDPLRIDEQRQCDASDEDDPIRLSYHLNYYALGEHYNQVISLDAGDT